MLELRYKQCGRERSRKFSTQKYLRQYLRRNIIKDFRIYEGKEMIFYIGGAQVKVSEIKKIIEQLEKPLQE